jgi:tetratricopeptide (TPR) repeat protein
MRGSHVLCFLCGATVVGVIALPRHAELPARAPVAVAPSADPRIDAAVAKVDQLASQLDRIQELAARIDATESALAEARDRAPDVVVIEPPPPIPTRQRAEAFALTRAADLAPQALAAWRAIEESSADPKRRAEACFEQGEILRKLEDWEGAAEAFRKVVDQVGLGGERGQTAAYQLGLCECRRGDKKAAYDAFRRLCDAPNLCRTAEYVYRYQMATFAIAAGEIDVAKRELERYVADYQDHGSEFVQDFVKSAGEKLARLK